MCGIIGQFFPPNTAHKPPLASLDLLHHRGPDSNGVYLNQRAFLGHTRLSIIDLEQGSQPMIFVYRGKKYVLVYNGELYNYRALQRQLQAQGIPFRTDSDTEVFLKWLVVQGVEAGIQQLNGIFAFCLYNETDQQVYLGRDRLGVKPLYYCLHRDTLYFASELTSLVEAAPIHRQIAPQALQQYLSFGYALAPQTLYQGVYELPPAHTLSYSTHQTSHPAQDSYHIQRYWSADSYERDYHGSYQDAVEELDGLLHQVIADQLVSDVGCGTFVSGGIDSSLVTAIAAQRATDSLNAYTVSFHDPAYDELPFARAVVNAQPGLNHRVLSSAAFQLDLDFIDLLLTHFGQPFADSSAIPMYLISSEASQHERVMLSGDGGDELFFGYDSVSYLDRISALRRAPSLLKRLVTAIVDSLPHFLLDPDVNRRVSKALSYAEQDSASLALSLSTILDCVDSTALSSDPASGWLADIKHAIGRNQTSRFDILQQFLLTKKLPADMLRKVDRMSMARSIEVRVPLLDNRIVDFALRLPLDFCYHNGVKKRILRDVAQKYVPQTVLDHKKWGFSMPMHTVLSRSFLQAQATLLYRYDFLRPALIDTFYRGKTQPTPALYRRHSQYTVDHVNWMLLLLHRWVDTMAVAPGMLPALPAQSSPAPPLFTSPSSRPVEVCPSPVPPDVSTPPTASAIH